MKKGALFGAILMATLLLAGCSSQNNDSSSKSDHIKTTKTAKVKKTVVKKSTTSTKKDSNSNDSGISYLNRVNSTYQWKDKSYKTPSDISKIVGNYSISAGSVKGYLTVNSDGTYTKFLYGELSDENPGDGVADYADKDSKIQHAADYTDTYIESGLIVKEFGRFDFIKADSADSPYSYNDEGKLTFMTKESLVQEQTKFNHGASGTKERDDLVNDYDSPDISTSDGDMKVKSADNNLKATDYYSRAFMSESLKETPDSSEAITLTKLDKQPEETKKSTKQLILGMKYLKRFNSLNEFLQYTLSSATYVNAEDVKDIDLAKLQNGYTSNNKKITVKYAYLADEDIYATDGTNLYQGTQKDDDSGVDTWTKMKFKYQPSDMEG